MVRSVLIALFVGVLSACGGGASVEVSGGNPGAPTVSAFDYGLTNSYGFVDLSVASLTRPNYITFKIWSYGQVSTDGMVVCVRQFGSPTACGGVGTNWQYAPSTGVVTLSLGSIPSVQRWQPGGVVDLEIFFYRPSGWRMDDSFEFELRSLGVMDGGGTYWYDYQMSPIPL